MNEGPILTKWHKDKNPKEEEISRYGQLSTKYGKKLGVRRKTFNGGTAGEQRYAHKEVLEGLGEAEKAMRIYKKMKDAGVPVASFAKILRKKNEYGEFEYDIAMEDLTEGGNLSVVEDPSEFLSYELSLTMKKEMVKTLARIHNLGIFHTHPGISFALQSKAEGEGKRVAGFKVIDYANFDEASDIEKEAVKAGREIKFDASRSRSADLMTLLYRLNAEGPLADTLTQVYEEELKKKSS